MKITQDHIKGGATSLSTAALVLAGVFIPHWESGSHMDTTVRHQKFDPPGVYTVCDGITNLDADFKWIRPGMKFTVQQCKDGFQKILPKYIVPIKKCIPGYYDMPPHRQISILSFGYNLGDGRVCHGGISQAFNAGDVTTGCKLMGHYVSANHKVLPGLVHRRFDPKWGEIAWCLRND